DGLARSLAPGHPLARCTPRLPAVVELRVGPSQEADRVVTFPVFGGAVAEKAALSRRDREAVLEGFDGVVQLRTRGQAHELVAAVPEDDVLPPEEIGRAHV